MKTKTRFLLRLIILILLLPLILWSAITTVLPVYLEKSLLPSLTANAGIDNFHVHSLSIGLTQTDTGFIIGSEKSPAVAIANLSLRYKPTALLAGQFEELSFSGLEVHTVLTDKGLLVDDPGLQQLLAKPFPSDKSATAKKNMQLPVAIKRVAVRQSALICRMADRVVRLPFTADVDLAKVGAGDGPLLIRLQLFPGENQITLTADLNMNQAQAHLTFSANDLSPRQFASIIDLPAGLQLNTRLHFSGSADIGISPFVVSDVKAQLFMHDSTVQ